jgi:hypothetical protein
MRKNRYFLLLSLPLLGGCLQTTEQLPAGMPIGVVGQEQACAGALADRLGVPMSAIRVNGRDRAPNGNTVVFLQSADLRARANCEVDDYGNVRDLVMTGQTSYKSEGDRLQQVGEETLRGMDTSGLGTLK